MITFIVLHKVSLQYSNASEDCLSCRVYIWGNVGTSLVEIMKGMSGLVDKQVDTYVQNQNLKMKVLGFTQAFVKCEKKVEEKRLLHKNIFTKRRLYILEDLAKGNMNPFTS